MLRTAIHSTLLFAAIGTASTAFGQDPGSRQTREFVQASAQSDAFEIMEANAALAQSDDPQVLAFARMLIRDHAETSRTMEQASIRAGLKPPPLAVGAAQSPFLAALQSLRGAEFDEAFWRQQALAHRAALVTEQKYLQSGHLPDVKKAAAAAVPIVERHLQLAEQMSARASGS